MYAALRAERVARERLARRVDRLAELSLELRKPAATLEGGVRDVILQKVDSEPGIEVVAMGRYATAPEAGAQVILASEVPVPLGFVDYIEGAIRSVSGPASVVRVTILQAAPGANLEAPQIEEEEPQEQPEEEAKK